MATGSSWIRVFDGSGRLVATVRADLAPVCARHRLRLEGEAMRRDLSDRELHAGPTLRSFLTAVLILALIIAAVTAIASIAGNRSAQARYQRIVSHGCQDRDPQPWCWGQLGVHGK